MKVIDLLNKIANGEKVPKKIKYDNDIWNYDEISKDYILIDKSGEEALICEELNLMFALNDEVEIIEEDKKIESLYMCLNAIQEDQMCSEYDKHNFEDVVKHNFKAIHKKINEIIDYLEEKEQ